MPDTATPAVTPADRDRRWSRIREFLAKENLAAVIIAGLRGREGFEPWVSNESIEAVVIFPAEGEPVHLTWIAFRVIGRDDPQNHREYWISDLRAAHRPGHRLGAEGARPDHGAHRHRRAAQPRPDATGGVHSLRAVVEVGRRPARGPVPDGAPGLAPRHPARRRRGLLRRAVSVAAHAAAGHRRHARRGHALRLRAERMPRPDAGQHRRNGRRRPVRP
jgi:hypothetical protein